MEYDTISCTILHFYLFIGCKFAKENRWFFRIDNLHLN